MYMSYGTPALADPRAPRLNHRYQKGRRHAKVEGLRMTATAKMPQMQRRQQQEEGGPAPVLALQAGGGGDGSKHPRSSFATADSLYLQAKEVGGFVTTGSDR